MSTEVFHGLKLQFGRPHRIFKANFSINDFGRNHRLDDANNESASHLAYSGAAGVAYIALQCKINTNSITDDVPESR